MAKAEKKLRNEYDIILTLSEREAESLRMILGGTDCQAAFERMNKLPMYVRSDLQIVEHDIVTIFSQLKSVVGS